MNKRLILLSIAAVALSFVGGFLVANALNRNELGALRTENENLKKAQNSSSQTDEEGSLSGEEIREKIAEADRNPANTSYQKNLGLALYNYAAMKQDDVLLREVSRLLQRVYEKNPDDYETVVALGNLNFDIGYSGKNNDELKTAREFYQKALSKKPDDANVMTDLGLTYFLSNPPQTEAALAEFQKSLNINPKDERTLQVTVQALTSVGKTAEAEKLAAQLKEINPAIEVSPGADEADEAQKQ